LSLEQSDISRSRLWLSTLPAVTLLVGIIAYGTAEMAHAELLGLGQDWWPEYHELRHDPQEPTCDPNAVLAVSQSDDVLDDLFDDEEEPEAKTQPAKAEDKPDEDGEDEDFLDDLWDEEEKESSSADTRKAAQAAKTKCLEKHALYKDIQARITPGVLRFRAIEKGVAATVESAVNWLHQILVLILMICGATATALRAHIALRPVRCLMDDRVSEAAQLISNILLLVSAWLKMGIDESSGVSGGHAGLQWIWMVGFLVMALLNLIHLLKPQEGLKPGGKPFRSMLSIPIYTTMCLIAGSYFLLQEGYGSGLATYLSRLPEHAILYIHVGLYVWAGMLLKQTRLATLFFDLIRPWRLPPELMAAVVVLFAAIPTAYSGASGIFVIAVGAVIYRELRAAGARRQLAMAATAMSGSLGVVLQPCLLVVIVASLNQEVTTDQLFGWGYKVFLLTSSLFVALSLFLGRRSLSVAPPSEAIPGMLKALRALIPYAIICGVMLAGYALLFKAFLDEHSAPVMLPLMLMVILVYDRRMAKRQTLQSQKGNSVSVPGFAQAISLATSETTGHIGALLMLMALSVCLGGIVERADLMAMVPQTFGSIWMAMSLLVIVLVIIGMTMDPYGAVILVSATIASVAYRNGIDPVHFWMVVLVAFELGYLTPPVALNHLLTRQVIGDEEAALADEEGDTFWARHERILLPLVVMATALLIVAFGPLIVGYS
jgi:TRAP-type C4-dicarboxylate transport system permease large subunit